MEKYLKKFRLFNIISLILILPMLGKSQRKDNIEFSFFSTYNEQAKYSSQFGNVAYINNLNLHGTDLGFKIDYKRLLYSKTFIKIGLGYLDFEIDKIDNETGTGNNVIKSNARPIKYPSTIFILYSTTKYHYNNLLYHFGIEKQFGVLRSLPFFAGIDYFHANGFSQKYYIPKAQAYYSTSNNRNFGDFFNFNLGMNKELGDFSFLPALVLSVYKSWKQDIVFYENPSKTVSNWFSGIGISLSVSYH